MSSKDATTTREALALTGPAVEVELERAPGVPEQLARALWRARGRQQGVLRDEQRTQLGTIAIVQRGVRLDSARVTRFRDVCADRGRDGVAPAVFLETLFIGPMASIALHPRFPFSPLGLVHVVQRIEQLRWVRLDENLDLRCHLAELRHTTRGYEVDCAMALHSDGELVWRGLATLLSRDPATRHRAAKKAARGPDHSPATTPQHLFDAPADVGRRYAAASGDYNPHHLHTWTARLVGFRRPIAHGIWTLARSLAELGATTQDAERLQVEASFKRPIFLPGRVAVQTTSTAAQENLSAFVAYHPERGEPHMTASVRW